MALVNYTTNAWTALATDPAPRIVNVVRGDIWVYPAATVSGTGPLNKGWSVRGPVLVPASAAFSFRGPGTIDVTPYFDQRPQQ